ncbi:MAG: ABC transporter ATP-binding protein [Candidatus Coatesbacteria bacterium]|nr:ABC transporter ATP-binding protein [Candidatus Coatesbacteria bacterium]
MSFINIDDLSFSFDKVKPVFRNMSFRIEESSMIVLLGENGKGKTTLSRLILGLLQPDSGNIFINNINVRNSKLHEIGKLVGYMFQDVTLQIIENTVLAEIDFNLPQDGKTIERRDYLIELFRINELMDKFPLTLSRGELQKAVLVSILATDRKFLILDEPTSSLDIKTCEILKEQLLIMNRKGTGMLVFTQDAFFKNLLEKEAEFYWINDFNIKPY